MTKKHCTCLLTALVSISGPAWAAEPSAPCSGGSCGDNAAISSLLLAAGMYGLNGGAAAQGLDLSLNESAKKFKGVFAEQGQLDGQDITLSYTGSSGRLGFSAGYLYTAPEESGAILLGLDAPHSRSLFHDESEKPWYLTFNMSKEFQISESLALGLDSRTMLLAPSSLLQKEESETQALCLSFNLPVSYGGLFTVTPELQWSRSLEADGHADTAATAEKNPNTFYGGMSVSFSY
ncbi:MAG: hypothetical protein ACTFAL_02160 [Candidatus Electronema sp. V4]|uniref:hypothetical protein n=1 Tax=Candidatus Electronema sp. V4 TaxID=3454756 RepID=UPI0040555D3E